MRYRDEEPGLKIRRPELYHGQLHESDAQVPVLCGELGRVGCDACSDDVEAITFVKSNDSGIVGPGVNPYVVESFFPGFEKGPFADLRENALSFELGMCDDPVQEEGVAGVPFSPGGGIAVGDAEYGENVVVLYRLVLQQLFDLEGEGVLLIAFPGGISMLPLIKNGLVEEPVDKRKVFGCGVYDMNRCVFHGVGYISRLMIFSVLARTAICGGAGLSLKPSL